MCKKLLCLMAVLIVALAGSQASATNWFGGWVDDNFLTAGNWTGGDPAGQDDVINQGHTVQLTAPSGYSINSLTVGDTENYMNTLNMNGGSMNVVGNVILGSLWASTGDGTLNMSPGSEIVANVAYVGHQAYGEINMYGGRFYAWGLYQMGGNGGTSLCNLLDGIVDGTDILMFAGASIVITDGMLQMSGDWGDPITKTNQYIANGWIVPSAGKTLQTEIYNDGKGIRVTAVPEPATIALLGLGGLLLRRRKR